MKIGIDIRPLLEAEPSGVGEYTRELLTALFSIDRENEYHLFANSAKITNYQLPITNYPNVNLHHFRYPNKLLNASMRFLNAPKLDSLICHREEHRDVAISLKRLLRFARNDKTTTPYTLHPTPSLDLFFMPIFDFAALSSDIPLVVTMHDLSPELYPSFFSPKDRLRHRLIAPRKLAERATHICAVSEHTKSDLVKHYGIPPEKITVTYPAISEKFFNDPSDTPPSMGGVRGGWPISSFDSVRQKYDLPGNFILFLATLEPRKNFKSVIEAFELLKKDPQFADLHLVLAGRKANRLPLTADRFIHFLGYVPSEDRPALYRLARTFVYPSYYEGFGLPPLEAMASGTPIIASHASSLGEVIGNAGILIDPYNVEDLHRALRQVLTHQTLADKLSTRGRERAREFSWQKTARQTLEVFKTIPLKIRGTEGVIVKT